MISTDNGKDNIPPIVGQRADFVLTIHGRVTSCQNEQLLSTADLVKILNKHS